MIGDSVSLEHALQDQKGGGIPAFGMHITLQFGVIVLYIGGDQVWEFGRGEHIYD